MPRLKYGMLFTMRREPHPRLHFSLMTRSASCWDKLKPLAI
jgi:hypothetical protein